MERKFSFSVDEFYHIYSRGVDKRTVFNDDNDRNRFIKLLFLCNHGQPISFRDIVEDKNLKDVFDFPADQSLVDIGAYCLMNNHFHLLIREKKESGTSTFMLKLLTAYSSYYNKKYERKGKLFDGTFQAKHLDTDEYLKYIYSYIHLNPVKIIYPNWKENGGILDVNKAKKFIENYRYSSYDDYVFMERQEGKILNKTAFPDYFETKNEFKEMLNFWLNYQEEISLGLPSGNSPRVTLGK
ncbi:MAG: hypothetical protein A2370_02820 [Candidatus Vogelbacteria bacterium RIFOXYB1_FULL_42_16]|uniref:Transposase IS200-like domain-containing protein n=1 Tax=Candidatus Vogelbacteria bacterium RIFOXYB1_FULL_42_16 TaxID=1802436 RepID=A0A1G2QFE3_9BACT|nr:MAG: hypothetical protein A2370_02820 [Candidatus Vogelbacteria bacterium RIFOXYB1_FULL_42_16]